MDFDDDLRRRARREQRRPTSGGRASSSLLSLHKTSTVSTKKNFKKPTKSQTPGIKPATFLSSRKIWFETCLEKATGIHHRLNCWGGKSGINLGPPRFPSFTPRSIEITSAFSILRKCAGYAPELSFTHRFKTSFLDFIFFSRSARKRAVSIRNFSYKVSINNLQIIENGSLARSRSKA